MLGFSVRKVGLNLVYVATLVGISVSLAGAKPCLAADPLGTLPEDDRLENVQSPGQFFGFAIGSRHLRHDQVVDYTRYLAGASDRVQLEEYGTSHGRRPVLALIISAPENLARLEAVRRRHRQLSGGRLAAPRSDEHLVMYMGYGVHGDEASAMNAATLVAYHLASSQSPVVAKWLERSVYLLDPALNPDGNDRFANWANENRGQLASRDPADREHRQAWPGGRTNYYWFDLNRDWLPLTHPESRGRLRLYHRWKPNVVLDFHEMGSDSSYFFQPGIPQRTNPLTPKRNVDLTKLFAKEHAQRLDAAGELFFTEERYDDFYIGKGSTYPDIHGSVGILFEQGSSRGLAIKTERTHRTFADSIANQVRTSLSSLSAAHDLRDDLLQYQCEFYQEASRRKPNDVTAAYVLTGEPSRVSAAHALLRMHDVRCVVPAQSILIDGVQQTSGRALLIPMPQPEGTLVQSLMETRQQFDENIFYDVSTWHLPSAFDLQAHAITHDVPQRWTQGVLAENKAAPTRPAEFSVKHLGFAIPPDSLLQPRIIAALQQANVHLRVATKAFQMSANQSVSFPAGTVLVLRQPNNDSWNRIVQRLVKLPDVQKSLVHPLKTSQTAHGPDLGSSAMLELKPSRPALIVGEGTERYTAGAIWHHLDVRVRQPTTLINTNDLARVDLDRYSCAILPGGDYAGWGDKQMSKLKSYVDQGGTLIAVGSAAKWLDAAQIIELPTPKADDKTGGDEEAAKQDPVPFGSARDHAALQRVAGAFLESKVDPTHPLAFGFEDESVPVFRNSTLRFHPPSNPYQTAAVYGDVIAGFVSQANREKLKGSAAVFAIPHGEGRIVVLADNPVFRGYVRSTEPFLTNAIYFGPSLEIPPSPRP